MILRSVVFVAVCAPVWAMYSSSPAPGVKPLPAISAFVWTGIQGTLCFATAANRGRPQWVRRIRVKRHRSRSRPVPIIRVLDLDDAGPFLATPAKLDFRIWPRVHRAVAGPPVAESAASPACRPVSRTTVVRFFDGRTTLCGINGVTFENPTLAPPLPAVVDDIVDRPAAQMPSLDARRQTG